MLPAATPLRRQAASSLQLLLGVGGGIGRAPKPLPVRFVFREEQIGRACGIEDALAQLALPETDDPAGFILRQLPQGGAGNIIAPRPVVAEPEGGQEVELAGSGPRLCTVIWMSMSSGAALAYSTKTSK